MTPVLAFVIIILALFFVLGMAALGSRGDSPRRAELRRLEAENKSIEAENRALHHGLDSITRRVLDEAAADPTYAPFAAIVLDEANALRKAIDQ